MVTATFNHEKNHIKMIEQEKDTCELPPSRAGNYLGDPAGTAHLRRARGNKESEAL